MVDRVEELSDTAEDKLGWAELGERLSDNSGGQGCVALAPMVGRSRKLYGNSKVILTVEYLSSDFTIHQWQASDSCCPRRASYAFTKLLSVSRSSAKTLDGKLLLAK